jgi:hypothetical protein
MKNTQKKYIGALILGGLLAATQTSYAGNITIRDQNAGVNSNEIGFNGGPSGTGNEDNETESGYIVPGWHQNTDSKQVWDLEGFYLSGSKLSLVGGFDFQNGQPDRGTTVLPGHLFIQVGSPTRPGFDTASVGVTGNTHAYTYAIDIFGGKIYNIDPLLHPGVQLDSTTYDFYGSNPWTYLSGGDLVAKPFTVTYETGLDSTAIFNKTGDHLLGDLGGPGANLTDPSDDIAPNDKHNVLTLDLTSLFASFGAGQDIWLHYAEQCGNDVMEGHFVTSVPDGGASAMLLGFGILGLAYFGRRAKTA